jgi:hypothetical protein
MLPKDPKPPHPGDLMKVIRKLALEGKYSFSSHALDERMEERGFDADDVLRIIANGDIDGAIKPGKRMIFVTTQWIDP